MNFLDKLERKYSKFSIQNLMLYIVIGNVITYVATYLLNIPLIEWLYFDPSLIMKGQIWRIFSYIFIPVSSHPIWFIFAIFLYYSIGSQLEYHWGSFKFNAYYLLGMIFNVVALLLTVQFSGIGELVGASFISQLYLAYSVQIPVYINMSLFLAYAVLFPDVEFLLYGILPIKVKFLAVLDVLFLLYSFVQGDLYSRILIVISLLNFLLFFGSKLMHKRPTTTQKQFKTQNKQLKQGAPIKVAFHKCTVCGKTELTDPEAEFRYCSKCNGNYEYCMDHLHNHEHIK